ncbi:Cobalamin (Vitamin B12) biosynthesis CbiX protein [Nitrosopumilaceae archaeon]|nr:sirohydrochlorin cobaltochelatase [Nitrosopumilus sp.]CAI9831708.1 Cobalamin (Vitamin B12) biosynthesis CbiX protein [Nitrosopumilaceae archaeon]MDA7944445.1 sirohydrochlorin cobaltochelatase [Nitrosopumilus sp.]MDA7954197.1 sirohydrochlorin cobaltochelatase [Nitrosopumilus sp.]MDA7973207.1 sirohydrochlorin cobaltochelatase [Nitrosopumilus sp.]
MTRRGMLIIDRGSREREASEELENICEMIQAGGRYASVRFCFLEVVPPYIDDGIAACLKDGLDTLTIVPYFLYPGKKTKNAVTDVMRMQADTDVKFRVTKQMSMHPAMVEIVESRITAALEEGGVDLPREKVDVMIVGHGSVDPNAKRSLDYVVNALAPSYRNVSRCWLEIEQPDIAAGVATCERDDPEVLVIVFYFLHEGAHVKLDVNADLKPALERSSIRRALLTKHIGADDRMVNLVLERAKEVEDAD